MRTCDAPLSDETLLSYWACDATADETDQVETHLFECADCAARLENMASVGMGLKKLVRDGRVSGIVSRSLINRIQRDGLYLRLYPLAPGEAVPCTVFAGDDLVVASLRADFSGARSVTLAVTGPGDAPMYEFDDVPVSESQRELWWALPGAVVRQFPSRRLRLTLTSAGADRAVLGEYVLDHSAYEPAPS